MPRLFAGPNQRRFALAYLPIQVVNLELNSLPYGKVKNVEHWRVSWLLNEVNAKFLVHYRFEFGENRVATGETVTPGAVDLQCDALLLEPALFLINCTDLLLDDAA
jgi:hypothetical protein